MRRRLARLVVLIGIGLALLLGAGRLPDDTSSGSLFVRLFVGLLVGIAVIWFVRRAMGSLAEPPPPSPPKLDATSTDVVYECPQCGTRVRLEVAATGKPPRHCGEVMEPSLRP